MESMPSIQIVCPVRRPQKTWGPSHLGGDVEGDVCGRGSLSGLRPDEASHPSVGLLKRRHEYVPATDHTIAVLETTSFYTIHWQHNVLPFGVKKRWHRPPSTVRDRGAGRGAGGPGEEKQGKARRRRKELCSSRRGSLDPFDRRA